MKPPGTAILSHGFESGPEAVKTTAMARVARGLGWQVECPDYREHDRLGLAEAVAPRCRQLQALAESVDGPLVLAGSSLGAWVSGRVSLEVECQALFLMAVPPLMLGQDRPFDLRQGVPTTLLHGMHDELCPVYVMWEFARDRGLDFLAVPDGHRLENHVDWVAAQFALALRALEVPA